VQGAALFQARLLIPHGFPDREPPISQIPAAHGSLRFEPGAGLDVLAHAGADHARVSSRERLQDHGKGQEAQMWVRVVHDDGEIPLGQRSSDHRASEAR